MIAIDLTPERSGRQGHWRWLAPLALLLLLALVALSVRATYSLGPSGLANHGAGATTLGSVVHALLLVGVAALELAVLAGIVFFPWKRLREAGRQGQPVPRWSRSFLLRMAAIPTTLLAIQLLILFLAFHSAQRRHGSGGSQPPPPTHIDQGHGGVPVVGSVSFTEATLVALGLGVVLVLGLAVALIVSRRRQQRLGPTPPRLSQDLSQGLELSLDELASGADPRQAVITAYERMERTLAAAGIARSGFETPLEYLERALGQLRASRQALARLTDLFETARFSLHPVDQGMRVEAERALAGLRQELAG